MGFGGRDWGYKVFLVGNNVKKKKSSQFSLHQEDINRTFQKTSSSLE